MMTSVVRPLRQNFFEVNKEEFNLQNAKGVLESQALAVACMVKKKNLVQDPLTRRYRIAKHVRQLDGEPQLGFGTAFMATRQCAYTAAQCVDEAHFPIDETFLVFGFQKNPQGLCPTDFPQEKVAEISKVVYRRCVDNGEGAEAWAVLELTQARGICVLDLDATPPDSDEPLYVLEYHKGTSLKVLSNIKVTSELGRTHFLCSLDGVGGSPGAPVLSRMRGSCLGILDHGDRPSNYPSAPCQRVAYLTEGEEYYGKGEQVLQDCSSAYIDLPSCMVYPPFQPFPFMSPVALPGCYLFGRREVFVAAYPTCKDGSEYGCLTRSVSYCKYLGCGDFSLEKEYYFQDSEGNDVALTAMGFYECAYRVEATTLYFWGLWKDVTVWHGDTEPGKMRHFAFIHPEKEALRGSDLKISCSIIDLSRAAHLAYADVSCYEVKSCGEEYAPHPLDTGII